MSYSTPDSPLDNLLSDQDAGPSRPSLHRLSPQVTPLAPVEAHTAAGPSIIAEADEAEHHHTQLLFKRLRKDMPLPGRTLSALMLSALFTVMFLAGWNDASQGPLLPSLQAHYNVDYLIISIIWIMNFVGFMTSGITNVLITDRFGFGIAAPFGATMEAIGYILMASGGPYPLFAFAYVINGFGLGLQDAQVNALTSRLPNANTKMFLMHAMYGFGATISPLISTQFVKHVQDKVYLYFWASLGLACLTIFVLLMVFQLRTEDQVVGRRTDITPPEADRKEMEKTGTQSGGSDVTQVGDIEGPLGQGTTEAGTKESEASSPKESGEGGEVAKKPRNPGGSGSKMRRIMSTPAVHYMAFYICIYVGVEVTIGGWATSFLVTERNGNDNAGYVTTGYFAGLTLGRVILIPVTTWIGKRNSIYIYSAIAIVLEVLVWTIHSLVADAVFFAIVGFVLGPMYPVVMMVVTEVMPGELQAGTIGWIASLGQAGSAMMPFITGGISDKYGVWVLQPIIIAFLGFSLVLWFLVPRPKGLRV